MRKWIRWAVIIDRPGLGPINPTLSSLRKDAIEKFMGLGIKNVHPPYKVAKVEVREIKRKGSRK